MGDESTASWLRVSELIGLKWSDIDFDRLEINLSRGIVDGVVGTMKTEASRKPIPLDSGWPRFCSSQFRHAPKSKWGGCQGRSGVSASRKQSHHTGHVHASGHSCKTTGSGEGCEDDSANNRDFSDRSGRMKRLFLFVPSLFRVGVCN
jgi:hypothetical protein